MCNECSALRAMRETLSYQDKEGNRWNILAVGKNENGKGKFQIQRDGSLWQDKWIESNDIAGTMADLGADIHAESRSDKKWAFFQKCIEELKVSNN